MTLFVLATAIALPSVAALRTNVVERSYDRFGRLVGLLVNGERRTEIAYDGATGRIASMRVADADEPFRWEYEPGSDLKKSLRYPNGAKVTWEYEPHRDFVTLVSNDVYSAYRYEYDAAGLRVAKNDERYEYNERGELILATNGVVGTSFAYRYDDIGNRLWSREFGTNCVYAANELNQYTNVVRGGVSERTAFDLDGNQTNVVTSTGEWAVEYNGENRPVRWTRASDGATVLMAFDRMGRRVRKNDETFVYDGYLNVSQTVWDPTEPVATRPLVWRGEDGVACFYTHDANKNVSDVVDATSGETAARYDYAGFGRTLVAADLLAQRNQFGFGSEFVDDETDLVYYNYRHYNHVLGRWLSMDLIESICPYLFCQNDPIGCSDRKGNVASRELEHWSRRIKEAIVLLKKAYEDAEECLNAMSDWRPRSVRGGDTSDKYRHCLASCELSLSCGEKVSYALGFLKEMRDGYMRMPEEILNELGLENAARWVYDHLEGNTTIESAEDLMANYSGLTCARSVGNKDDCECCCEKSHPK